MHGPYRFFYICRKVTALDLTVYPAGKRLSYKICSPWSWQRLKALDVR